MTISSFSLAANYKTFMSLNLFSICFEDLNWIDCNPAFLAAFTQRNSSSINKRLFSDMCNLFDANWNISFCGLRNPTLWESKTISKYLKRLRFLFIAVCSFNVLEITPRGYFLESCFINEKVPLFSLAFCRYGFDQSESKTSLEGGVICNFLQILFQNCKLVSLPCCNKISSLRIARFILSTGTFNSLLVFAKNALLKSPIKTPPKSKITPLIFGFIKKISFPKIKMQFEPIFLQVLWQFLSARRSRLSEFSRGDFLAAAGGENRPNYFKNRPHFRKAQGIGSRLASLGGQLVLNFG